MKRNLPIVRVLWAALFLGLSAVHAAPRALPPSPDKIYGALFTDVQRARIFADQKTFPDCVPRGDPAAIVADYAAAQAKPGGVNLRQFVTEHFLIPETTTSVTPSPQTAVAPSEALPAHLAGLWNVLRRAPDRAPAGSSLLPLPFPYVVPGGRFREIYYWDSYFTMLGLRTSGREDLVEAMVENFSHELHTYGLIPNGNRTYYLSRSQPPFFALMVELLAETKGAQAYRTYLPALAAEYAYWMDETFPDHGADASAAPSHHVVHLPDGGVLNRYFDRADTPRPEAFANDEAVSCVAAEPAPAVFRNLRSTAESGWDFSSRWFGDGQTLATIRTTSIVPVDLNCLLYQLECTLAKAYDASGDHPHGERLRAAAVRRKTALLRTCWSEADGFFFDYDLAAKKRTGAFTLAGIAPLFLKLATPEQASAVSETLRRRFLRPGGVVTTLVHTGQQWDAPNGWAPLEWMTIRGLENYGDHALAADIAHRWIALNRDVYRRTGKMMEKYNVEDLSLAAGGGEYPAQDGFGWTNGVLLELMRLYP